MKSVKKDPFFRDMVRTAACIRIEKNSFLKDDSNKIEASIEQHFKEFSFLKDSGVKKVLFSYLNSLDRGV